MGDKVEFKKVILIMIITITIIIGVMFGISYGWYSYNNAQSNLSASTIKETPTVIFSQTEYISSSQTMPIYDKDRYNYANKNSFTITINENLKDYQVGIEISLINISMPDELKISNYKYELLQDGKSISQGDFSTIGKESTLKLLPMSIIETTTYPKTYNYELLIWLSEDETDQNNLMNKTFSAKVNINSAIRK